MLSANEGLVAVSHRIKISSSLSPLSWTRITVRKIIIDKVHVISSEIYTSKRRIRRNRKPSRPTACQRSVQCWCHSERTSVGVIEAGDGCSPPYNVDSVVGMILGIVGLSEEVGWALTCNVYLHLFSSLV